MMSEALQECLSRFLKIDTLIAEHSEALEALISGRDVIAILPTGFGKSLSFQLFCEVKLASNPNTVQLRYIRTMHMRIIRTYTITRTYAHI